MKTTCSKCEKSLWFEGDEIPSDTECPYCGSLVSGNTEKDYGRSEVKSVRYINSIGKRFAFFVQFVMLVYFMVAVFVSVTANMRLRHERGVGFGKAFIMGATYGLTWPARVFSEAPVDPVKIEFKLVVDDSDPNNLQLADDTIIDNGDIAEAIYIESDNGAPSIKLCLTGEASYAFAHFTDRNRGRKLAILLDGQVNGAPVIKDRITGGVFMLPVTNKNRRVMKAMARGINAGE